MKNKIFTILLICLTSSVLNSQISGIDYTYSVLKNDFGLKTCKGVIEINESILIFDNHKIAIYDQTYSLASSRELLSDYTIQAISIHENLIYCAIHQDGSYRMNIFDYGLNEIQSVELNFLFSDFEKTSNGYFFFNIKINNENEPILFFTDNNFVSYKNLFESSPNNMNLIVAPTSKMTKRDTESIYFNLSGTGEIYRVFENGEYSLVYDMGTSPSNFSNNQEMNSNTISSLAENAPIVMYTMNDNYLFFFSQKSGNYIYFFDKNTNELIHYPASVPYDSMEKFDFTGTCPSTFLTVRNKFAALLKGKDVHLVKEMVTPPSKTDHIPECDENDIVLMTFNVSN